MTRQARFETWVTGFFFFDEFMKKVLNFILTSLVAIYMFLLRQWVVQTLIARNDKKFEPVFLCSRQSSLFLFFFFYCSRTHLNAIPECVNVYMYASS